MAALLDVEKARRPPRLAVSRRRFVLGGARWARLALAVALLAYLPWVLITQTFLGADISGVSLGISLTQVDTALIVILGALGLNVIMGWAGLVSIGNAGFFALGAIVAGLFGVTNGLPLLVVLVLSAVAGAVAGVVVGLPSLRVRGLYLILATLAFHYIAIFVFLQYQLAQFGEVGIIFETPDILGVALSNDTRWYFFLLLLVVGFVLVSRNLLRNRQGRALLAIEDYEAAATASGVNVGAMKLKAFALSSAMVTMAGSLYVWYLGSASQDVFTLKLAIDFAAILIIGGLGSVTGVVLGALFWQLLPQIITTLSEYVPPGTPLVGEVLNSNAAQVNDLVLGLVIIVVLLFAPTGLAGIYAGLKRFFGTWPFTSVRDGGLVR